MITNLHYVTEMMLEFPDNPFTTTTHHVPQISNQTKTTTNSLFSHFQTVLRIWDSMFCEGAKVIHRAALALILTNSEKFGGCTNFGDVTVLMQKIVACPETLQCHTFLQVTLLWLYAFQHT